MKKVILFTAMLGFVLLLGSCSVKADELTLEYQTQSAAEAESSEASAAITGAEREERAGNMEYDFKPFSNVHISGTDISSLNEEELAVLYAQARYCQAMTDADIDTMRELVSEDMVFTHMSGMQQTREEYFADVADGSLNYFTIGIADPVIKVDGEKKEVIALLGAGSMGTAIVRRIAAGRKILLGDISGKNLERVSHDFQYGGYDVETMIVNALEKDSVEASSQRSEPVHISFTDDAEQKRRKRP